MTPIVRRVVAGLGANAFGQAINVLIQVLSLPLFLHRWDLATYGTWLVLSAIPAYLSMADVGMVTVAGNEMTMAMGRGEAARANSLFQSILALLCVICAAAAALVIAIVLLVRVPGVASLDERLALLVLALGVLITLFAGLIDAVFKATNRFAAAVMLGNLTRLAELAGSIAGLFIAGTFVAVALGLVMARLIWIVVAAALARRGQGRDFQWGFEHARRTDIFAMVRPAVSFMAFPLANALSLQGVTIMVGHLLGPASVAIFNTYRTLARLVVQLTGSFSTPLWPEFSRLYGHGGSAAVGPVYRRAFLFGACIAVGPSLVLYPAAPLLLRLWTHGAIAFEPMAMGALLAYAAAGGLWHVPRVLLMSTNLHVRLAQWTLVSAVAVLVLSWPLGRLFGLPGIAFAMLSTEALIAAVCIVLAHRMTQGGAMVTVQAHP